MKASTVAWTVFTAAACFLGSTAVATAAVTAFPYVNGFESGTTIGDPPPGGDWTEVGDGSALVDGTTVAAGTKSVCINDATLTLNVDAAAGGNKARVRLFCKPVAYDMTSGDPVIGTSRAAFVLGTDNKIWAYSGAPVNDWVVVASGVPTDQWLGFLVTLDYDEGLWDLYLTTEEAGAGFNKLNTLPLKMAAGGAVLSGVSVSSGTSAYVDEFSLDKSYTVLVDDEESQLNMQYLASVVIQSGMSAREIARYFDSTSDALNEELGVALARALSADAGAKLHVYFPASGMSVYQYVAGSWSRTLGGGPLPAGVHLNATTGFWLETTVSGTVTVDTFGPSSSGTPSDVTLEAGWNMLAWPWGPKAVNPPAGIGLPTTGKIFIYRPGSTYLELRHKTGLGWVSGGGTVASPAVLSREQSMWYNATVGGDNWNVDSLGP